MLIERVQRTESRVAKVAFVGGPVPGQVGGHVFDNALIGTGDEAGGVGNEIRGILGDDKPVQPIAGHASLAVARLHVENESGLGDEGLTAAALDCFGDVDGGFAVTSEVTCRHENAFAIYAVMMALAIVLVEPKSGLKSSVARATKPVHRIVMVV